MSGETRQRRRSNRAGWRDGILFLTGLALIIHEAVIYSGPERWGLLMLYAGMVGSPVFLSLDERRQANDPPAKPATSPEDG